MTVGLIVWGRFVNAAGQRVTVPAPVDGKGDPWLVDFVREHAAAIGASFDVVQWPPVAKAQGGAGAGCDGYGVFDRRDIGSKHQQGSIPTRYGTAEGLLAAVAALRAHGVESWGDLVMHQLIGENGGPGVFRYLGADGVTLNGRGRTSPGWFRGECNAVLDADGKFVRWADPVPPFSPRDPVPDPPNDSPFGRELVHHNCVPANASLDDAKDYAEWLTRRVGFAGYRLDDTKGTYPGAARAIMDAAGTPFYSEHFDGNPANLNAWATSAPMAGRSAVADFTLHWRLQAACNGFDARLFDQGGWGYGAQRSDLAVGFVDNPDTDTSPGEQVISNKAIGYALMLSLPLRAALVYGKDYFPASVWPGAYGLKPIIDNICWFARMFAFGTFERRWVDRDVYAYTREGNGGTLGWSGGCLVAVNFNTQAARTVTLQTMWPEGAWIHDYSGHCPDATVAAGGKLTVQLPANANSAGVSYGLFARGGVNHAVPVTVRRITQTFVGAADLDTRPARNGLTVLPQRICCAQGSQVDVRFKLDRTGVVADATVQIEVLDATTGERVGWATTGGEDSAALSFKVVDGGWHLIRLVGNLLPAAGAPFEMPVTYLGSAG